VRERLLGGTLELHGVDIEHVARKELQRALRKLGAYLAEHEREDALAFVVSEVWRASLDFDPARGSFGARASFVASRRLADWIRKRHGRERDGSGATAATSANGRNSSRSTSIAIDWTRLSPRGQAILRLIAIPVSNGCSQTQIALNLGTSTNWVSRRLAELRDELSR
jgi:DNA-directed RNA polymerase specialized sigma24 family protein